MTADRDGVPAWPVTNDTLDAGRGTRAASATWRPSIPRQADVGDRRVDAHARPQALGPVRPYPASSERWPRSRASARPWRRGRWTHIIEPCPGSEWTRT